MFERKGLFLIAASKVDEEKLMEIVLDAGADDLKREGDTFQVTCPPEAFNAVSRCPGQSRASSRKASSSPAFPPTPSKSATSKRPRASSALMDALDDHDDVQSVVGQLHDSRRGHGGDCGGVRLT